MVCAYVNQYLFVFFLCKNKFSDTYNLKKCAVPFWIFVLFGRNKNLFAFRERWSTHFNVKKDHLWSHNNVARYFMRFLVNRYFTFITSKGQVNIKYRTKKLRDYLFFLLKPKINPHFCYSCDTVTLFWPLLERQTKFSVGNIKQRHWGVQFIIT